MTTEKPTRRPSASGLPGLGVVARCAVATAIAAAALAATAWPVAGSGAAVAALTGGAVVLAVFALGTVSLHLVARAMPAATLLVALVTYLAQGAALLVLLVALTRSATLGAEGARAWLVGGVVLATVAWTVAQVVLTARARMPIYDLPVEPARSGSGSPVPGGER